MAANVRRFAKRPVGIAGHVDWQATSFDLGASGKLLGSGPSGDSGGFPLLIGLNRSNTTINVYEFNPVAPTLSH